MNTPSPSPQKQGTQKTQPATPQTNATGSSFQARSRPRTATPSSSSDVKQTLNEENVRRNAEEQGLYFEDEESYAKYPDFQTNICGIVFGTRDSAIRDESLKKIKKWRAENATSNEKTYLAGVVPLVLKDARSVPTNKRTFPDQIKSEVKSFDSDDLHRREDQLFVKDVLPLRTPKDAARLGLTTAKPDFVYGLKPARHPDQSQLLLSLNSKCLKNVAPGLDYPFFTVDGKGCSHSIEAAENQAQRSGATMVAARAGLNDKAKGKLEVAMPEHQNASTSALADTAAINDATAIDPSSTATHATADTILLGPQLYETNQEDLGPDIESFAFTCSWTPQMAKLHVHWREYRPNGIKIYHMNCLGIYRMGVDSDLRAFRSDVHNILDWGISAKRRDILKELELEIAKNERELVSG